MNQTACTVQVATTAERLYLSILEQVKNRSHTKLR